MPHVRREKLRAIVLSRRDLGEADRLLVLFTRSRGLIRVVAKGVRKIPSRRGGHLEPLSHVIGIVGGRPGHYYLAAVEPAVSYTALQADREALQHAVTVAHLIQELFEEEEALESLFDAFHQACDVLPTLPVPKRRLVEAALVLYSLRLAGVLPQLAHCQVCGVARPSEAVVLSAQDGGWRCLSCHDSFHGAIQSLSPQLLSVLRWLTHYPHRALQLKINESESEQLLVGLRHYLSATLSAPLSYSV